MARRAITERTVEEILERVDNMTAPGAMTKPEALDTIYELRVQLQTRWKALTGQKEE